MIKFQLTDAFIKQYVKKKPDWGYNGLSELTFRRTYSTRNNKVEEWWEVCRRVVEGCYNIQKKEIDSKGLGWNAWKAQKSAQEMYNRMFTMKFLPPGRGLWAMGSSITEEKKLFTALFNCSFVSTENIKEERSKPFRFLMDMLMVGCGVGFDVLGAGKIDVVGPDEARQPEVYEITDDREGWVKSVGLLIDSYLLGLGEVIFDYGKIRPAGEPIKGFGGTASGPDPLIKLHNNIVTVLTPLIGQPITVKAIVDIMNMIGCCVVAGNVRRSSEIALGLPNDTEFINLKNYEANPERSAWGWASNNSVTVTVGQNYSDIAQRIADNGEPGLFWIDNAKIYGRINGRVEKPQDNNIKGLNPCAEITLESYEMCNLVETFPSRHTDVEDYKRTLKYAYLYSKTVTLTNTHWPETNRVMLRNRRIGCSISGIANFLSDHTIDDLKEWMDQGYKALKHYDEVYSDWFCVPRSKKMTTIKPSGTISLVAAATPGMHFPESRFYIRRVRMSKFAPILPAIKKAGYHIEDDTYSDNTVVVEVPVDVGEGVRTINDITMWEQLHLAALIQRYWSDNAVSCTVTVKPEEYEHIETALNYFQYHLKSISFLPKQSKKSKKDQYAQLPYEEIDETTYKNIVKKVKVIDFSKLNSDFHDATADPNFCDSEKCIIPQ